MEDMVLTLEELAEETGCQLVGDPNHRVSGAAELANASASDASFVAETRFVDAIETSKAGVIFIDPHFQRPGDRNYLLSDTPAIAFQQLTELIQRHTHKPPGFQGIHSSAVIHESAQLGADVQVGPHAVIERDVVIGDRTRIGAGAFIGPEVQVGEDVEIHHNVALYDRTVAGDRVVIEAGSVIGSCGFGYRQDDQGHHQRYPHLGNVIIGDDVEIGANSCIDRARLHSTRIGRGTKIDNLVQVAHNVDVGEDNILVAHVGIAGSSSTGRWCVLAGRAGLSDHIKLCDKVVIAACSAVAKDITTPGTYVGLPAIPLKRHHRLIAYFHNIDKLATRVTKLRQQVAKLEDHTALPKDEE